MAVPPTHDGSVGPRSATPLLPVLSTVFAVVIVAGLVLLGIRYTDTSGTFGDRVSQVFGSGGASTVEDESKTRELVISQANLFVNRVSTFGPADLDESLQLTAYKQRVDEVVTPKFSVEFEQAADSYAAPGVAQAGLERSVELYASGLYSIDDDSAIVLVTGAISQSYPDTTKDEGRVVFEPRAFRYHVDLVRTEGQWLVDYFCDVRDSIDCDAASGLPGEGATDGATVDPTTPSADPTGTAGAGSPLVQSYAEIIARRSSALSTIVTTLDECQFPGAATAGDQPCVAAPRQVGASAQTIVSSLRGAANPDSNVFVGRPPATITDLVDATSDSAQAVVDAVDDLRPACITGASIDCRGERNDVVAAVNDLINTLDGWADVS